MAAGNCYGPAARPAAFEAPQAPDMTQARAAVEAKSAERQSALQARMDEMKAAMEARRAEMQASCKQM